MNIGLTPEQTLAVAGIIGGVIGAGVKGIWIWGWVYRAMEKDRDFWRNACLQFMGHANKSLELTETVVKKVEGA